MPTSTKSAVKIHHFSTQPTYTTHTSRSRFQTCRDLDVFKISWATSTIPLGSAGPISNIGLACKKKPENPSKLDMNRSTPGHGAKIQDSNCFFWKKISLPDFLPSFHDEFSYLFCILRVLQFLKSTKNLPMYNLYMYEVDDMLFLTHFMMIPYLCDLNKKLHLLRQSLGKCKILVDHLGKTAPIHQKNRQVCMKFDLCWFKGFHFRNLLCTNSPNG